MVEQIRGLQIFDELKKKTSLSNDSDIANYFDYPQPSSISQMKDQDFTKKSVVNLIQRAHRSGRKSLSKEVQPIVEFYPTSDCSKSARNIIDITIDENEKLRRVLSGTCGIYSFYNSELEIIYVGKTKKNDLWSEIVQSYNIEKTGYERYKVSHPGKKYRATKDGLVRKISRSTVTLKDATRYFSAYAVPLELVDVAETLLIRMVPNDLLNVRMEGNTSMRLFVEESE